MILLFGDRAAKTSSTKKNSSLLNNPVENSGILAMGLSDAKSLLTIGEYDTYVSSNPYAVDYSMYSNYSYDSNGEDTGFMSGFSAAVAMLGDSGFSGGFGDCGSSFGGGFSSGSTCSSFSSVG